MSAIATHLWSSTIVLLMALIAARLLPLTARTRHALLLSGLAKFAVPSVVFNAPLRALGIDLANLGKRSPGVMNIEWLGGPEPLRRFSPAPSSDWPDTLLVGWVISAMLLAAAWAIARQRLISSALRARSTASPRERAALTAARHGLELRASVDVIRSTISEAPAVVRIIRPLIVLPDGGCDALDDAELESLLRHECAHVARRDNLVGIFESAIVSAFWFHPLVWVAQRAIATAREEACDEVAASTTPSIDTYVSALSKICRSALAPRLAGVSCMASAHLKERLKHLMGYETLRARALSHRLVVALAATAVLSVTIGSGVRAATAPAETPYGCGVSVRPGQIDGTLEFAARVSDGRTGAVVMTPNVTFKRGSGAKLHGEVEGREVWLDISDVGAEVVVRMRVAENGVQVQETTHSAVPSADRPRNDSRRTYSGDPMTLDLKDAEIKDVLTKFAKMTGLDIRYQPDLQGSVTLSVRDIPWDQAFDLVLAQNDLTYELNGKVVVIRKR